MKLIIYLALCILFVPTFLYSNLEIIHTSNNRIINSVMINDTINIFYLNGNILTYDLKNQKIIKSIETNSNTYSFDLNGAIYNFRLSTTNSLEVYKSINNGLDWNMIYSSNEVFLALRYYYIEEMNRLIVVGLDAFQNSKYLITDDNFQTNTTINSINGIAAILTIDKSMDDKLFIGTLDGSILYSEDYGLSWLKIESNGFKNTHLGSGIREIKFNSNIGILSNSNNITFISNDNGATWVQNNNEVFDNSYFYKFTFDLNFIIGIGRKDNKGIFSISYNNGATWEDLYNFDQTLFSYNYDKNTKELFFVTYYGDIYKTTLDKPLSIHENPKFMFKDFINTNLNEDIILYDLLGNKFFEIDKYDNNWFNKLNSGKYIIKFKNNTFKIIK